MKKLLALLAICFMLVATFASCDFLPGGEQPGGEQPGGEQPGGEETPEIKSFKVTFNTDGAGDIAAVTVEEGNAVAEPTAPEKDGYTFLGWYNGDAEYDFTAVVAADLTLTAKWEANKYTLTFGETPVEVTYGTAVGTLPAIEEREGYDGKWFIGETELTADTVYSFTEDKTAEAKYTIKTYTVTYTANGETRGTETVEHGATATDPGELVEGGYHVAGWTLNGEAYDFATEVKSDIELVAVIEPNKYTLTFGETPVEVTYGTAVGTLPAVPEQEGYDGKWTLNGADLTAETVYNFTEDLAAEASYTIKTYSVVLKLNGETYNTVTVEHGATVAAPDANIVVGAYYVSGWTLDGVAYDFATPVKSDLEIIAVVELWDPSYGTQKGTYSYYISNFDNASVMTGITIGAPHNPWFNEKAPIPANGVVKQGTYSLVNGTVQGINLSQTVDGYAGFGYNLPTALDLSGVDTIVTRVAYGGWNAHYANFYMIFKSGDTYVNAINYATQYNTYNASFAGVTPETLNVNEDGKTDTLNVNFRECWVEIDIAALMAETGMTSIDAIYFCQNSTGFVGTIDEIYYTVPHEDVKSDFKVEFTTSNLTAGQHTLTDTADGYVQMSGPAWALNPTIYSFDTEIKNTEIAAVTFRFKTTGTGVAVAYVGGSADGYYVNLGGNDYVISRTVDSEGFTVLKLDFTKIQAKAVSNGVTDENFATLKFKVNNANTSLILDYVYVEYITEN